MKIRLKTTVQLLVRKTELSYILLHISANTNQLIKSWWNLVQPNMRICIEVESSHCHSESKSQSLVTKCSKPDFTFAHKLLRAWVSRSASKSSDGEDEWSFFQLLRYCMHGMVSNRQTKVSSCGKGMRTTGSMPLRLVAVMSRTSPSQSILILFLTMAISWGYKCHLALGTVWQFQSLRTDLLTYFSHWWLAVSPTSNRH